MATQILTVLGAGSFSPVGWDAEGGDHTRLQSNDGDSSRLYTPSLNSLRTVTHTPADTGAGTINSLTLNATLRNLNPIDSTHRFVLRFGTTNYYSPNIIHPGGDIGTAYGVNSYTWTTNPATGNAWTQAEINNAEFGLQKMDSNGTAWTYFTAVVDYEEVRLNNAPNPRFVNITSTGISQYGGGSKTAGTDKTINGTTTSLKVQGGNNGNDSMDGGITYQISLPAGNYKASVDVSTTSGVSNAHFGVRMNVTPEVFNHVTGAQGTTSPYRTEITFQVNSTGNVEFLMGLGSYGSVSSGTAWFTNFLIEKTTESGRTFFDGASLIGGFTHAWTGIANNSSSTQAIVVGPILPIANFNAAPLTGFAPLAVQFTDTTTGSPTSWLWSFGDTTTSTLQNPLKTYTTPGTYSVTLTSTNANGSDGETKSSLITVTEPPQAVQFVKSAHSTVQGYVQTGSATLNAVASGNFLIAIIAAGPVVADFGTLSDTAGNTWVKMDGADIGKGLSVWYVASALAGNTTVNVTGNGGGYLDFSITLREYIGVSTTNPIVKFVKNSTSEYVNYGEATITPESTGNALVILAGNNSGPNIATAGTNEYYVTNAPNGSFSNTHSADKPFTTIAPTTGRLGYTEYVIGTTWIVELQYGAGNPKTSTIVDDFDGTTLSNDWSVAGQAVSVANSQLTIPGSTVTRVGDYSIEDSFFYVRSDTNFGIKIQSVEKEWQPSYDIYRVGTVVGVRKLSDDGGGVVYNTTYNASTMKYWRMRESNNVMYFEYSADTTTWTEMYQETSDWIDPSNVKVMLQSWTGSAIFDSVNIPFVVIPVTPTREWHPYGVKPMKTTAELRQLARAKYDAWFGYTLATDGMPTGLTGAMRIKVPDQGFYNNPDFGGTVSEGQGYGMLMKAWFSNPDLPAGIYDPDAKEHFDKLFKYYDHYKNVRGLMHWNIKNNGDIADQNGATDGDLDAAMGLVIMARLHASTGTVNYSAEATELINAIRDWEFVPATGVPGTGQYPNIITNGDGWGFATNNLMPDYFRPGFMREFYYHTGDSRWLDIVNANYTYALQYYYDNYAGGLVPDRQTREHTSLGAETDQVTYNSVRLGFGVMYDYLWNGTAAPVLGFNMMNKMANKAKANFTTGGNIKAPNYNLNFSTWQEYSNLSGYGLVGPATLGLESNQVFATQALEAMAASTEFSTSYFNGGVGLMGLMAMTGIGQNHRATASVSGYVKVYNGSQYVIKPIKVWNGTGWVVKPLKRYNGNSWESIEN